MNFIERLQADEALRREQFPVAAKAIFMAHASVTVLPKMVTDAMREFCDRSAIEQQESAWTVARVNEARALAAALIGAHADEIALIGPTALGLSMVAQGLDWNPGDEVVSYYDDYPSNVYPWRALEPRGVKYVPFRTAAPGAVTWEAVERALTLRTRLVSLASCHFVAGRRIDVSGIGRNLHERGILFCLDGIQTLGAFPTPVEHVDFMAADAHKWLLGPGGIGVFYVRREARVHLQPILLGASNVVSPDYLTQSKTEFLSDARRYEPGALNWIGAHGLWGALKLIHEAGPENIATRLLAIRERLVAGLCSIGFTPYVDDKDCEGTLPSAIVTVWHADRDMKTLHEHLSARGVIASLRRGTDGRALVRFSPHFYNTDAEIDRVIDLLR